MRNRFKALRNLAAAAVLLAVLWLLSGAPLPTQQLRLRRAERQNILDYAHIVWRYDSRGYTGYDTYFKGADTLVGLTPTAVHVYARELTVWPRDPGTPVLVCLPAELPYGEGRIENGNLEQAPALLAFDAPAGAASARLTLSLNIEYRITLIENDQSTIRKYEEYVSEGVRDGEAFLFQLTRHYSQTWDPQNEVLLRSSDFHAENDAFYSLPRSSGPIGRLNVPYTLEFFDGSGELIGSWTGTQEVKA